MTVSLVLSHGVVICEECDTTGSLAWSLCVRAFKTVTKPLWEEGVLLPNCVIYNRVLDLGTQYGAKTSELLKFKNLRPLSQDIA